jgi:hypothetical protein
MCLKVVESPSGVDLSPSKLMGVVQPSINYFGVVYPPPKGYLGAVMGGSTTLEANGVIPSNYLEVFRYPQIRRG